MDQQKFEFPRESDEPRRKRYRKRKPLPPPRPAPGQPPALVEPPVVQRCGFCGSHETLMGEIHVCKQCGGILVRDDD